MRKIALVFTLLIAAAMAWCQQASMSSPGLFLDDWAPKKFDARIIAQYDSLPPVTVAPTVTVSVDYSAELTKVPRNVFSHNTHYWMGATMYDNRFVTFLQNLGSAAYRYPGGDMANGFFWNAQAPADLPPNVPKEIKCASCNGASPTLGGPAGMWMFNMESYYSLIFQTSASGSICVNYGYARYNTSKDRATRVAQAAKYAADWVNDVNIDKQLGVKFWEIGNENYKTWQLGSGDYGNGVISGTEYGEDFCRFAEAMKKVDPTIKIGAILVETSEETDWDAAGVMRSWNEQVLSKVQDHADYFVIHANFTPAKHAATAEEMLNAPDKVKKFLDNANNEIKRFTNKPGKVFPVAITEFNTASTAHVDENNGATNVSHANGLFFAQVLGELVRQGCGMAAMNQLVGNYAAGEDKGMFANHEDDVTDRTPHPSFYHYYYYKQVFGDKLYNCTSSKESVRVYPTTFASGEAGVVVVNKSASAEVLKIDASNFKLGSRFYWYEITAKTPFDRKVAINGQLGYEDAGAPDDYNTIKPYMASTDKGLVLNLKPYSAYYIVIPSQK